MNFTGKKSSSKLEKNPAGYSKLENWKNQVQIGKGLEIFKNWVIFGKKIFRIGKSKANKRTGSIKLVKGAKCLKMNKRTFTFIRNTRQQKLRMVLKKMEYANQKMKIQQTKNYLEYQNLIRQIRWVQHYSQLCLILSHGFLKHYAVVVIWFFSFQSNFELKGY